MRKTRMKAMILLSLTIFMIMITAIPVSAAYSSVKEVMADFCTYENGKVQIPSSLQTIDGKLGITTSSNDAYAKYDDVQKEQVVLSGSEVAQNLYYSKSMESSILSVGNKLAGDSTVEQLDDYYTIQADVKGAAGLLDGLRKPFSQFIGIVVTLITIGMTLFTAFDLAYIAFPTFRGKMDTAKQEGTRGLTRTNSSGETKLNLVSEDAQYAVKASDMAESGKNPFITYGSKRIVSFVVLSVLLFILLTGNINIITNIGLKLASGVIDVINNAF